jgi:hypothetical protein
MNLSNERRHKKSSILEGVGRDNIMMNRVDIHAHKYNRDKIGNDYDTDFSKRVPAGFRIAQKEPS